MAYSKNGEDDNLKVEDSENENSELLKAIDDLKQELNFVKSDLHLLKAAHHEGSKTPSLSSQEEPVELSQTIAELEENIDRLCIQESALSYSLESETLQNLYSLESLKSDLNEMLYEYSSLEVRLTQLSTELSKEYSQVEEAKKECLKCLREYTANERERSRRLHEDDGEDENACRERNRKLREIRFMQLIIPRIVSEKRVNFLEEKWLAQLCQKVRDPIISADDLL